MPSTLIVIFFYLAVFTSTFAYARDTNNVQQQSSKNTTSQKEQAGVLIVRSLKLFQKYDSIIDDPSIVGVSKLDEKRRVFANLSSIEAIQYLISHGGFYTLSTNQNARMFYFFFPSKNVEGNKSVMIWLNGGPGISSSVGLFYENGPIKFASAHYRDINFAHHGWDNAANILYIDQPIGTGLSYESTSQQIRRNQVDVSEDLYDFLQQFFGSHVEHKGKYFFISGQGYAARYASSLGRRILQGNDDKTKIYIDLKGIAIGNALIDLGTQYRMIPKYAWGNYLITTQDLTRLEAQLIKPCEVAIKLCVLIDSEDACTDAFDKCDKILKETKLTIVGKGKNVNYFDIRDHLRDSELYYDYSNLKKFLNRQHMKTVLNVLPVTRAFKVASSTVFEALKNTWGKDTTLKELSFLLNKTIPILFYTGERDLVYNHLGTEAAVKNIPWLDREKFISSKPIDVVMDNNVVGEQKKYGPLTHLTVLKAGHMVAKDCPNVVLKMIQEWMKTTY